MFAVQVRSQSSADFKYIVAVVPQVYPLHDKKRLSELTWHALEFRTLPKQIEGADVETSYRAQRDKLLSTIAITRHAKNGLMTHYTVADHRARNIGVSLVDRRNMINEYRENGTLLDAIETFHTIITSPSNFGLAEQLL